MPCGSHATFPLCACTTSSGSATVLPYIGRFGFPTPSFPANDLTVALGSQDTAPLEIVAGYASIANGGSK